MKPSHRYFPVNESQREWGLYATCVGRGLSRPGDEFPSRAHPDEYFFTWEKGRVLREWQLILLTDGRGTVEFAGRRHSVERGSLVALAPGCWHRYRPNSRTGWSTLWIGFGGDVADRLAGGAGLRMDGEVRSVEHAARFRRLFGDTVSDILARGDAAVYSTAAKIPAILAALMEARTGGESGTSHEEMVHRAQGFIAEHANGVVDFAELADSLGVPYRTLRHVFAKETGSSLLQYQLGIRLARAKALLKSSDIPISEIAATLGFNSTWYFAHFFAKATGVAPREYRKQPELHGR